MGQVFASHVLLQEELYCRPKCNLRSSLSSSGSGGGASDGGFRPLGVTSSLCTVRSQATSMSPHHLIQ
jgi:hypothetical protein